MLTPTCALAVVLTLQVSGAPVPAQPPPPADRPIHRFVQNLGNDLVALPGRETAIVLGASVIGALAVRPADDDIQRWVEEQGPADYTRIGRKIGDGWVQGGAALVTYGAGLFIEHRATTHIGSDLIRAQALNAVLTQGLKLAIGRKRPSGSGEAMPSGHTSASFATAAVLANHFGTSVAVPAYAVAGFVGWTRVRDDAHWLTDVVVGSAVGTAVGLTVTRGHRGSNWSVVPMVSPNRVAVYVVRLGS